MVSIRTKAPSDQMLMVVGASTIHWSLLEAAIDSMVAMVFHRFGGSRLETEIPRMLGRKIKFLRKGFGRSPLLVDLKDEAVTLLDQVDALSDQRHLLTHGSPSEYWTDKMVFTKLRFTPKMQFVEKHELTYAELRKLSEDILHVALPLSRVAERMVTWIGAEHQGKPNGERPN